MNAHTPISPPAGPPTHGWSEDEIVGVIGPLLDKAETVSITSTDDRLTASASRSIRATSSYEKLIQRRSSGEHVAYGDLFDARVRLQNAARALSDMEEIVAIGDIPIGWTLYSSQDGLALHEDGMDEATVILPRGITRAMVEVVIRTYESAYDLGKRHGRIELQSSLRALLDVSAS